ncbi:hypothetical protein RchiOBHm_Chr3g0472031 [Rosa chinensis]|uniref:Uncharacterized protein n=1 Tax=Rosa chinensis TaxID=74649 RepID=A0A2P6RBJ3_ROSCH|nr:hypothetical protein RchiOBHm_Chr3g0472031 [Rosa chinensis]
MMMMNLKMKNLIRSRVWKMAVKMMKKVVMMMMMIVKMKMMTARKRMKRLQIRLMGATNVLLRVVKHLFKRRQSLLLLKKLVARKELSTQQLLTLQNRLSKDQLILTRQSCRAQNQVVVVHSVVIPAIGRLTQMVHCRVIQRQSMELQSEMHGSVYHDGVLGFNCEGTSSIK